jgi:hypothetical protein
MISLIIVIKQLALLLGIEGSLEATEAAVRERCAAEGVTPEAVHQKIEQEIENTKAEAKRTRNWGYGVDCKGNQRPTSDKPYVPFATKRVWASVRCAATNTRILLGPPPAWPASLVVHVVASKVALRVSAACRP